MNSLLLLSLLQINVVDNVADATEKSNQVTLSFFDLAVKGGWVMIPILILAIIAVYIFFERYYAIRKAAAEEHNFMNQIKDYIHDGKTDAAISLCQATNTPLSRMIEKGVRRIGRPLNDINAAIENVGNIEISKLEKGLPAMATVSGGSPMLGFLGTVMGMIKAFYRMSSAGNNIDVSQLSGGIYQAMVTTVAGLIVGIIAYFAYNILVAKVDKVVSLLESRTTEFMDLLNEPVS